jgi:RNA polymerase sigma-70 factor (ECF subfamily)
MPESEAFRNTRLRVLPGESYPDLDAVYANNVLAVYRLIFRQVGNRPDAEDLTEEVFLAVLHRLRLPAPVRSVRAYLAATVRTVIAEHWRSHYAAPPTLAFVEELGTPAFERAESDAANQALRVLAVLPDRFRQILELRFLRGLSVRQAAEAMGVTPGNARVLQHRALRRAAEVVQEQEMER